MGESVTVDAGVSLFVDHIETRDPGDPPMATRLTLMDRGLDVVIDRDRIGRIIPRRFRPKMKKVFWSRHPQRENVARLSTILSFLIRGSTVAIDPANTRVTKVTNRTAVPTLRSAAWPERIVFCVDDSSADSLLFYYDKGMPTHGGQRRQH